MLPLVFPLIADSVPVTTLIGTDPVRFFRHGHAPQKVQAPYCTWAVITGVPENTLDEVPRVDNFSIQVDCWSDNTGQGAVDIETLARAVRDALEPHAHMTAVVADGRDPETDRYRIGMQFSFWQDRDPES